MKIKSFLVLTPLVLTAALHAQQISKIVFTWTYSYASIPACVPPNVTTNCIHHFDLSENGQVLNSIPASISTSYQYTMTPLPSVGTHTYNLVAVEVMTGTATIASAPATVSLQVPQQPPVPNNFTALPQ